MLHTGGSKIVSYYTYSNNTDLTGETAIGILGHGVPKSYGKARLKPGQSYSADCQFVEINRCRL